MGDEQEYTATVFVPDNLELIALVEQLIAHKMVFGCKPAPDGWYLGVTPEGIALLARLFGRPPSTA